jgi:sugar phosphate permease
MSWLAGKSYYRRIVLVTCMLVYCTSQLVRWNYASITKYLITDLGIGKPEIGLLGSAFFYAYAIAQIPWGTATDLWGGRRVIPVGISVLALFLTGFAFTTTFTQAIVWRTYTEFLGIWYLGILTSLGSAVAALYVVYREKNAVAKQFAQKAVAK